MTRCSDYEVELSALMDGESDPAMALRLVEHVASCQSCSRFVRELRSTQTLVDGLEFVVESAHEAAEIVPIERKRMRVLGLRPQWAIGLAALLVLIVSVWFGADPATPTSLSNDLRDGELVIRLEEDKGRMSDERFVALVSELLRADRRYQNEMYTVLDEIARDRESGKSRSSNRTTEYAESNGSRWNEQPSQLNAAME